MRPPNILYILLPLLTVTGALEVTMRTPDVSALRGEDVTIPCQIRDLNTGSALSILWSRKSEDGTPHDVYEYNNGIGKAHRLGSSMNLMKILNGNADLHLPRVQFSDEGEYSCTVINTPNKAEGKATLQVSAPPLAHVTPESPTVEVGAEKTMTCEVYNFYPKDISIRWAQYRKGSSDCEFLEMWTCVKNVLNNSDGTYNVTNLLTLNPKMEDNGNIYSCIISHQSLVRTELSRNLTLKVTEREDNSGAIITAVLFTILGVLFLGVSGFLYFRFIKKDPPTLSEITGNDDLIDMNRTTLTCQIMDFRPNDIEISVCMRRSGEEETRTIYTWRSGGLLTPVRISKDGGGGDEEVVAIEEGRQLMNGSAGHEDRPLQLEMTPLIRRKKFGAFLCQCSLQITPSYDLDNGAELSVRVKHPALTSPVSVRRILNVIGVPPKLLSIMSPDRVTHEERLTLTCPINGFKPRDLSITWLRREKDLRETELLTWNSGKNSNHREKYSHRVKENEHEDKSFSYISALILKPTIREDDGVTYICRTFHPATDHREERKQILSVTAVPVLDSILKGQDNVCVGEKLDLSCRIHSFYPSAIQVTWYAGDDIITSSHTTDPLQDNDRLYHVTSTSCYTPTMRDLGKNFRCQVEHASLSNPKPVTWTLGEIFSPPTLGDIQCDPAQPERGKTVTVSCRIDNMYPGNPAIQWYRGLTRFKPDDWKDNCQADPESKIFSGTTELTFTPTSEEHGAPIRLEITHGGKTIKKDYPLHLKGLPVLSEISSDPWNPDYGRSLTLRCDVTGCDPGETPEVTWSESGRDLGKGQQRVTRGSGGVLSCSLTITPTAENYGKVYSCRTTHKEMTNPIEKKIHLRLPERPPTLSDIVVHPMRETANQEASFTVTISGYSPRDLQIKWYKEFCMFSQSEVTISDPEIGLDGLYKSSSTVIFTPKMTDHNTTLRCEVTHSQSKTIREKRYTLHLTGDSNKEEATKTGPEKKFQIREIKCVTERPRVGEEVTLVAYIEECSADSAEFTWSTGMFPIDGEMENRQDGTDCTSTITFTPEEKDRSIKLEVFYNYRTVEDFFTLPLV
ncbi:hemicentin-1-like isoform X2 [Rana temporaria]|uniref:hemicentin-1-like isoform X2 n=1 Tax=Rana temporaria TaxID=8407 RepID=UPI001AADE875|nr:hemicentin-1-like isoform X2 [Rana temporaria]